MRIGLRNALIAAAVLAACSLPGRAVTYFAATLNSLQETNPNASTATGIGSVVLNDAQDSITVNESWTGLTAPATASHIHTAPLGANGGVTFPFSGVPNATAGSIPQQTFAITPAQVASLEAGNMYFNVHTSNFPGGEIRGQIGKVPEPGTFALLGTAALPFLAVRRRRSA